MKHFDELESNYNHVENGFSLTELLTVVVILALVATALATNISPIKLSLDVETVLVEAQSNLSRARRAALTGESATAARTFDISSIITAKQRGVVVSATPTLPGSGCQAQTCAGATQSICVSDTRFCFTPAAQIVFERFTARLPQNAAVFVTGRRNLALLITREGKVDIAELVGQQWRTRSDLRQLQSK